MEFEHTIQAIETVNMIVFDLGFEDNKIVYLRKWRYCNRQTLFRQYSQSYMDKNGFHNGEKISTEQFQTAVYLLCNNEDASGALTSLLKYLSNDPEYLSIATETIKNELKRTAKIVSNLASVLC